MGDANRGEVRGVPVVSKLTPKVPAQQRSSLRLLVPWQGLARQTEQLCRAGCGGPH